MSGLPRALLCVCVMAGAAFSEQLPIKSYTTADGLPRNRILRIRADSRGFLWFCTAEGLSRFDGYRFVNYGVADGLPHRIVEDLIETRDGAYWIATDGGLVRFQWKQPRDLFRMYQLPGGHSNAVNVLLEDRDGNVWLGADTGLYRLRTERNEVLIERVDIGTSVDDEEAVIRAIVEDHRGGLWIGGAKGLVRRYTDGRFETYTPREGVPDILIQALLEDRGGRLWVGTRKGLGLVNPDPKPNQRIVEHVFTQADGLADPDTKAITETADGAIWAGTLTGGAVEIRKRGGGWRIRSYNKREGLGDDTVISLASDHHGNLWLGSDSGGAMRIVQNGFTSFGESDGLGSGRIVGIFEDQEGALCVASTTNVRHVMINRFDGERFESIVPRLPQSVQDLSWGWSQVAFQSRTGEWWLTSNTGVVKFPNIAFEQLAKRGPDEIYTQARGLPGHDIFRIFEDSRGRVWAATTIKNGVSVWDPANRSFHAFEHISAAEQLVAAFAEDHAGNIWLGLYGNDVVRYRHGAFTEYRLSDGVPAGFIGALYVDRSGRLWIGSGNGGLGRVDHPDAERPVFRVYTASQGLSGNWIGAVTEDQAGRIYATTGRGVDRLDPHTGLVKHYTTADGLTKGTLHAAFRDSQGQLWFGSSQGLSRLIPEPDRAQAPPQVLITAFQIAGAPYPVSQLGETSLDGMEFKASNVQVEFVGLNFNAGEVLRYQYILEGAAGQWSAPNDQRTVNLAGLSPGSYRFLVRAINSNGDATRDPASISFRILPPLWGRWWFQLGALCAAVMLVYSVYRYRLKKALELERIRMRIATDLHDDIGSSLSQIAILSEVARRETQGDADPLTRIAGISRELVNSMSDIVWAINPQRDNLLDLTRRMREFAGEMLVAHDIDFTFQAPDPEQSMHLGTDLRRQVFLIFKECVSNLARHSGARSARILFKVEDGWLMLRLEDDGRGFDPRSIERGHGLASMQSRAMAIGGLLEIDSREGAGTIATLRVPLAERHLWNGAVRRVKRHAATRAKGERIQ